MGMDATAILFWGIAYSEESTSKSGLWLSDVDEMIDQARMKDQEDEVPRPTVPGYRGLEWDAWRTQVAAWEREQCSLGTHSSHDDHSYYATVNRSETKADWGDPQEITSLAVDPTWEPKLRAFCERFDLPWREPKWWLVAYWG